MDRDEVGQRALMLAQQYFPLASRSKHEAFANSVVFMVTSRIHKYKGPSVREQVVRKRYGGMLFSFEESTTLLLDENGPIFGPLNDEHRDCWRRKFSLNNDPSDLAELDMNKF